MTRRGALAAVAMTVVALLAGACGKGDTSGAAAAASDHPLTRTDAALRDLRSATVDFTFSGSTDPTDAGDRRPTVGFRIEGPFSFDRAGGGDLPVADLRYTKLGGGPPETSEFLSTGKAAFVRLQGKTYAVPDAQLRGLRLGDGDSSGLHELRLAQWVTRPHVERHGATDVVTGTLRADVAFADLAALSRQLSVPDAADLQRLGEQDRRRLDSLISGSTVRVEVDHGDATLRSLDLTVDLRAAVDDAGRRALGALSGARLDLRLRLADVDQPVHVEAPAGAEPLP